MSAPGAGDERRRLIGWGLVALQFALIGLLLVPLPRRFALPVALRTAGLVAEAVGLAGASVAALRLGSSLSPNPVPRSSAVLTTTGPYRWVRHPIYSGLVLFATGAALRADHPVRVAAAVGLVALLQGKSRWEEQLLRERLDGYAAYAAATGRFVPRLRRR
ncbi:MAG: isoprenylcysteine carboxylmethyltransferase family protein [Acidimicrobiia bacterium]